MKKITGCICQQSNASPAKPLVPSRGIADVLLAVILGFVCVSVVSFGPEWAVNAVAAVYLAAVL